MVIGADATLTQATVQRALVRNKAKLAADALSAWIEGPVALPEVAAAVPGMDAQLRLQDEVAQRLSAGRDAEGAPELETLHVAIARGGALRQHAAAQRVELNALAMHCSQQEDAAQKVERKLRKCEAALLPESHVGQRYDAIVTGRSDGNTWVRMLAPPVEGMLTGRAPELDIGQCVGVKLVSTDVERGLIDFEFLH